MKFTLLTLILLATTTSFAAGFDLKSYVAKRIIVLDRPMMTFHYRAGKEEPNSVDEAFDQAAKTSRGFFNGTKTDSNAVGPGLYVAVDPAATRSYGQIKPQLLVATLRQGARILDFVPMTENVEVKKYVDAQHCLDQNNNSIRDISDMRNSKTESCRISIIKVLQELNVEAIMYSYSGAETLKGCRLGRSVAFNIISSTAFDPKGTSYFSESKEIGSQDNVKPFVSGLYGEGIKDTQIMLELAKQSPQGSTSPVGYTLKLAARDFETMKENLIFKCGKVRN